MQSVDDRRQQTLERVGDCAAFLGNEEDQQATKALRMAETTGRPVGGVEWVSEIERRSGRVLARRKPGPKPKESNGGDGLSELSKLSP